MTGALALVVGLIVIGENSAAQCRLGINSHGSQTLVIEPSGQVIAWGYNNSGQLGDSTLKISAAPKEVLKGEYTGTRFLGDDPTNPITAVAAIYRHSLALDTHGIVYGWGANNTGELGHEPLGNQTRPVRVSRGEYQGTKYLGDNETNPIVAISGGVNMSHVLARDGSVFAFGRNDYGQLGNGIATMAATSSPVRVLKGEYPGTKFLGDDPNNRVVAIATGDYHCLALTQDGSLYAWGRNSVGQLGVGDTMKRLTPVRVLKGSYAGTSHLGDNPADPITTIRAGGSASLVMLEDGTLMTWGGNADGKIGDSTNDNRWTPVHVLIGEYPGTTYFGDNVARPIRNVSVGTAHVLAVCDDGSVYSWGANLFGNLGDGSTTSRAVPTRVLRGEYPGKSYLGDNDQQKVRDVAAAEYYSIALVNDCDLYVWGRDNRQQLGDTSRRDQPVPIRVQGIGEEPSSSVALASFTAKQNVAHVELRWRTTSEQRNAAFNIERMAGAGPTTNIGSVPGQGTSSQPHDYALDDDVSALLGVESQLTYWLKQTAEDGTERYLDSVTIALVVAGVGEEYPGDAMIEGITPSPLVATADITYRLPVSGQVQLEIWDMSGVRVKTLFSRHEEAGRYHVNLDVGSLATGRYYCRLICGTFTSVVQMTVVR